MKCAQRRRAILGQGRQVAPCLAVPVASYRRLTDLAAGRTFRAPGSIANDFFILLGNIFSPGTVLLTNGNTRIFPFTLNFG